MCREDLEFFSSLPRSYRMVRIDVHLRGGFCRAFFVDHPGAGYCVLGEILRCDEPAFTAPPRSSSSHSHSSLRFQRLKSSTISVECFGVAENAAGVRNFSPEKMTGLMAPRIFYCFHKFLAFDDIGPLLGLRVLIRIIEASFVPCNIKAHLDIILVVLVLKPSPIRIVLGFKYSIGFKSYGSVPIWLLSNHWDSGRCFWSGKKFRPFVPIYSGSFYFSFEKSIICPEPLHLHACRVYYVPLWDLYFYGFFFF